MHTVDAHGASIPAIGLGTWTLKGREAQAMTETAIETGYRHIDTARMYANEESVGAGIAAAGLARDELFVTTKVWHSDLRAADLRRSLDASLSDLGLDQVDLFLIHWPNADIPLSETIEAMNTARAEGLTRHIGVSNFPSALLKQAVGLSEAPLVANQVENHPYLDQRKVHAACREYGIAMVSYCPLFRGGPIFSERPVADAARRTGKTPGQVVLRWHVQQEGVVAIPRTTKPERLKENIDLFDFELTGDEMEAISALRGRGKRVCDFDFSPEWDS
ncbi:MAG: aldo/keto reductase [Rhizobiaceae bacterium]|nr:aldo/keto reductase [Rhizobiaceae bacterium]MCV0408642.1 aldo/keto reductase [Rhizobiaceae bacterium]